MSMEASSDQVASPSNILSHWTPLELDELVTHMSPMPPEGLPGGESLVTRTLVDAPPCAGDPGDRHAILNSPPPHALDRPY